MMSDALAIVSPLELLATRMMEVQRVRAWLQGMGYAPRDLAHPDAGRRGDVLLTLLLTEEATLEAELDGTF
jgi:hypothetical protein